MLRLIRTVLNRTRRIFGPVFWRELRTLARGRWGFAIRCGYVFLLAYIAMNNCHWPLYFDRSPTAVTVARSMARASALFVRNMLGFQFAVLHLAAPVLLATSISNEVHYRRLGLLMSTPITGFEIVMGKFLARQLVLAFLLACSLPLIMASHVFGPPPWQFILEVSAVTITAMVFTGSLGMLASTRSRLKSQAVVKGVVATLAVLVLTPFVYAAIGSLLGLWITPFVYGHPYAALTEVLRRARAAPWAQAAAFRWYLHCLLMLGVSAVILAFCVKNVRRVALRQATGDTRAHLWRRRRTRRTRRSAR
jgi:ABC-type transport system involved in multi-copper enzyme maturation permease subunit